jgi:hypothetical protein
MDSYSCCLDRYWELRDRVVEQAATFQGEVWA